jgi:DNA-binding NarL/FixJ family response regulator
VTGDAEIADCALAFFLTEPSSTELPDIYKTALNSYNKTGKPRIFTYMKIQELGAEGQRAYSTQELGDDGPRQCSVVSDQRSADEALRQGSEGGTRVGDGVLDVPPHEGTPGRSPVLNSQFSILNSQFLARPYSHPDTLKLEILMQIKQLNLDGVDIHLEDGKAWQENTVLLSHENVEAVSGYENLQNLKQKRAELESRYYAAKTRHAENPDDNDAYEAFFEASKQRGEAIQEIRDVEAQLYHMMEGMYEQTSHGKLTTRQAEGYRLIERGLLNEARAVLDFDAIISESRHHEELAEQAAKRAQDSVNELMQLKDVNATLLDWDGVDVCLKEAARLEEMHNLQRRATLEYFEYLRNQSRHGDSIKLGEKLLRYYESPESGVSDEEKSFLYNGLGMFCYEVNQMARSEELLKSSLKIRCARKDGDTDSNDKDIAIVYNNLGNLYYLQNRFDDAIEAHKSALVIRKRLVEHNPDAFEEYLAYTYINLGAVYNEVSNYSESLEITAAAAEIFKKLAIHKPEPHEEYLSCCYNNLGVAYSKQAGFEEAEKQYDKSLSIQLRLAADNPGAYESRVAETYNEFGNSQFSSKNYTGALEKYDSAYKIYRKLADRDPGTFEPLLADAYANIGELHKETERFSEAEHYLNAAITLYDKYSEVNPAYAEKAANVRKTLANLKESQQSLSGGISGLSLEEQKITKLLADGLTPREIARKLNINANEYELHEKAIRKKLNLTDNHDPVIRDTISKYKLTKREADMLVFLRDSKSTEAIANDLCVSPETVRSHVSKLLKKLGIDKREAVAAWLQERDTNDTPDTVKS